MSETQNSGARRAVRRHLFLRPLTLTVMLALAGCTSSQWSGSQASGADPAKLSPEQSEAMLIKVADQTRAGGDFGTAVGLYKRAHEMAERDPVPLARLGETLAQMQAYNDAVEAYRAALSLKDDPDLHRSLGNVLLAMGKPQLGLAQLQVAAEKNPSDARVYNGLGVAYDLAGRHDQAQEAYRKGLGLAPEQLSLRNNLGLSQALAGDFAGGIATLSEVVTQPGATARNRQNLALVYGLAGDNQHAASVARSDLDEQAVRSNLAYYTLLRSMDDLGRTAAILGADIRATKFNEPAAIIKDSIIGEAP
ncbi:MAG TPA: tetratricopeptide repeat protein, partial [Stellaceae bacterium]|nr:tetratricopeptide repeat protein [Stellaceae bacterium]